MFTNRQGNTDTSEIQHLIDGKALSEEQTRFIDVVRKLSEVFGLDFEFYASEVNENGQRHGDAGYIDDSGKIHIDIFAGQEKSAFIARDSTLTSTLLHELTHFIHDWSPKAWKEMYNYVVARYSPYGSVQAALEAIRAREKLEGREISDDLAQDEFMAQCCEALFEDEAGIRDFAAKYKNTAQKIVEWLENVLEKISGINTGHSESDIAAVISQWQDGIEELREKWLLALEDAANNKNASEGVLQSSAKTEVKEENGNVRYSRSFRNAVINKEIIALVQKVKSGSYEQNEFVSLGVVSDEIASLIKRETGVDATGYEMKIEARQLMHIIIDHGENGKADQSMKDDEDIAKMEYVIKDPDDIKYGGKSKSYWYNKYGHNKTAPTVKYEKDIGDRIYYVIQAVPEAKAKCLYIVTAYMRNKNRGILTSTNAQGPVETSDNVGLNTSNNNIPNDSEVVKTETEKNSSTESDNKRSSRSKRDDTRNVFGFEVNKSARVNEDLLEELSIHDPNASVDRNGNITVYHRTTKENADLIRKTGIMKAKEDALFFSSRPEGYASDYGNEVLAFNIPSTVLEVNDIFDGEVHFDIPLKMRNGEFSLDVRNYLKESENTSESDNKRRSRSKRDMTEGLSSDIKNNLIRRLINQNAEQGEEEPSTAAHLKDQMSEKKERLAKMEPVAVVNISDDIYSEGRNDVLNLITDAFEKYGFVIQRQGLGDVIVDRKRLSKALSSYVKTANDRAAFTAVPNVIKDGLFIAYHEDHKSRHYGTITLAAPIIINGNRGNIGVVVKLTDKNYYKLHRIFTPDGKNYIIDNVKGDIAEAADGVDKQLRYTPTDNISYEDNTTNQSKSQENSEENSTTESDNTRRSRSKRDEKSAAAAEAEAKAGELAEKWGLSGKKTEALERGLTNIFESVSGAEVDMAFVRQQASSLAAKTANGMISPDMPTDISDKLKFLRSFGAVSLTEEQRNAAAKLAGTFKEYRSRISSAVKINEKGEALSTAWGKLSEQMPELFPADTAESDMARVMLQNVSRLLADERAYRMEGDELAEAQESLQREIYDAANQYIQYNRVTSGLTETKLKNVVPRPSVRAVLAEAALKTAKTDEERAALWEYQRKLETVNGMEAERDREYSKLLSMLPKSGGILKSPKSTTENYFLILPFHPINFCRVYFKFR